MEVKEKGKTCLTEEQAQHIIDSYSDDDLAYDIQWHTPEELAEVIRECMETTFNRERIRAYWNEHFNSSVNYTPYVYSSSS